MAQPTATAAHLNAILTNISVAYLQNMRNFISDKVFPVVSVDKQSDSYYVYTKDDWFRDEAMPRADGSESAGSGYNLATANYGCTVFAFHKDIGPQARANFDNPLNADRDAAQFVTQRLMLRQERVWAANFFANGVWGTSVTPVAANRWNTYATSVPAQQVEVAKATILQNTGFEANTMVVGYNVHSALKNHPDIKDQFKYTSPDSITEQMIARFFDIPNYFVAKAVVNTAGEGAAGVYNFVQGNHVLICYAAPSPSLLAPSAGYTFMWRGISHGLGTNLAIMNLEAPLLGPANRVEGQVAFDHRLVATDLGYFINNAVV